MSRMKLITLTLALLATLLVFTACGNPISEIVHGDPPQAGTPDASDPLSPEPEPEPEETEEQRRARLIKKMEDIFAAAEPMENYTFTLNDPVTVEGREYYYGVWQRVITDYDTQSRYLSTVAEFFITPDVLTMALRRRRQMSAASRAAKVKTGTINAAIESGLSGVRTTKAFANEEAQQQRFDEANEVFKTAKRGFHKEMGRFNAVMEFCTGILPVAVIAVGGWLIMGEKMDYVDLITFSLYVTAFVSPIRKLANFAEMFSNGFAGLHRFIELMATEPSIQDAPDAQPLEHVQGRVDVNDVSFAYGEKAEVLHNVTLHIPADETVALVGPSGGGKTTLCQLLPRFYDVDSGSITVDGRDVRAVTQRSLRRAIGIVQQDVFLFADTIRENIRYGRPDATDAEVEQAARQAEIYDDICAMPDGFDTYVGERGALLSGGQKQRVAIARVFLKAPPILILDEATSALDSVTESRIQGAFDRLARGRTTLIIAHRLSTIRSAGRILVIQDGVVAEQGSHQELLAKNGVYATLYRTQNLGA